MVYHHTQKYIKIHHITILKMQFITQNQTYYSFIHFKTRISGIRKCSWAGYPTNLISSSSPDETNNETKIDGSMMVEAHAMLADVPKAGVCQVQAPGPRAFKHPLLYTIIFYIPNKHYILGFIMSYSYIILYYSTIF